MRLDLTVTHAPDIKSKQPWPRLTWLGKQKQDLLLVDSHRIKVLCLNGKGTVKKKIGKLQSHLGHLKASNVSPNGAYLVCLLESGTVLIYQKDTDALKTVPGIDELASYKGSSTSGKATDRASSRGSPSPLVFISNDANKILVVIGHRQIFVWESDQSNVLSSAKQHLLKGTWSRVDCEGAALPDADCKETAIHAVFFTDSVLGSCCMCSFVFNSRSNTQISSVFLHWLEPYHIYASSQPRFTAQWSVLTYPLSDLSESAEPVRHHGAYLARQSHSGQTLAVAVNQRSPVDTRVLFVSVLGSTAVSANMKGCGCRMNNIRTEKSRSYWLADAAWTSDDLFLACMTKQGCLSLLSRLGEAVLIQSSGCSIEHEPGYFLPFHPLVTFIPTAKNKGLSSTGGRREAVSPTSSLRSEADEKRQRYSVSAHPTLPLLLLSDGYLVTVMELPQGLSCTGVVRDFLSQGRTAVNLLLERQGLVGRRLRSLSSLRLQKTLPPNGSTSKEDLTGRTQLPNGAGPPTLSLTRDGLLSTSESDFADYAGRFSHLEEGQFVYGDPTDMEGTRIMILRDAGGVSVIAEGAQKALLSAWGLAVSHTGEWTRQMEDLLQYTGRTLVKLFAVMLQAVRDSRRREEDEQYVLTLYRVLNLFKAATTVLHWDVAHHRSLPTGYRLIRGTVRAILRHSGRRQRTVAPCCCISILQYCEKLLANVYSFPGVHQPTFNGPRPYPFHRADLVEGALVCRDSIRIRGTLTRDDHVTWLPVKPGGTGGSRGQRNQQEVKSRGSVIKNTPAKRLIKTWKLLFRHLAARYRKLVKDRSTPQNRGARRVLLLLCGVQIKLRQLGCHVSTALCDGWSKRIDACFLRGCQWYLQGYPEEAVSCWLAVVRQTKQLQTTSVGMGLPSNAPFPGHHYFTTSQRTAFPTTGSSVLLSYSLLAILYARLEQYNLVAALTLVDALIDCYGVETKEDKRTGRKEIPGRWYQLIKCKKSFLGLDREEMEANPQLPCVPDPVQREAVETLARFMALYFTNHSLFVYPPCAAKPLPPLHLHPTDPGAGRTVPIYHDRVSRGVRQQQLSDVWTADTAMALLLVCGLLPEAVWLARELGDWKSALMLSVMTSQQIELDTTPDQDESQSEMLSLPESLAPLVIVKEGISVILQTPLTTPSRRSGSLVKRNSFSEHDRRGSHSLNVSGGIRRTSSMCSINEEDRIMQEQLSRSLTDMLTAATVADLDPTPWLLGNLMDRCLSLVAEFNTLVPEEFYLPAPPFYCPQPDYEPKDSDPEEVLFESSLRREVNDAIQLILLVLNSSKCSLPCARWYVQQLDLLLTVEARKQKFTPTPLPRVLVDHARYPVDLLKTGIDSLSLPSCTLKVLGVFRDLCTAMWMLHVRDKLTVAVRMYQASRERSLRVKPQNNAEVAKNSQLLQEVLMWADHLYPFSSFLNLEEEVQDILLTAIAELPPTKKTVVILARHFHENIGSLPPLLQEKFQRLAEKLKRKKELSTRKTAKKKAAESGKDNKRVLKYETLHQHYMYQCKLRKLTVRNRQEEIGSCELQVFEDLSEKASPREPGAKQDINGSTSINSGEPSSSASKQTMKSRGVEREETSAFDSKEEDNQYPRIGSREFESSPAYLDFLETFFLVAFGKIIQENAPFSGKAKLPLIGAYSAELRQKEFGSIVQRMSGNTKPKTVQLDASSFINSKSENQVENAPGKIDGLLHDGDQNKPFKSRSMFHHNPNPLEENPPLIPLRKHGSQSSLQTFRDMNKEMSPINSSQRLKQEPPSRLGILQPYSTIVLNLGDDYHSRAELLRWFGRWAERQLAVYAQTPGQADSDSKAVLRVRLPQQLVLNSMWLARHVYNPDFSQKRSTTHSSFKAPPFQKEHTDHDKPHGLDRQEQRKLGKKHSETGTQRKSKVKRPSKKKNHNVNTDSEEGSSNEGSLENARRIRSGISEKRTKKKKSTNQEKSAGTAARKRRQLPEVTEVHRTTSPRNFSSNAKIINQLLMRAKSPNVSRRSKSKSKHHQDPNFPDSSAGRGSQVDAAKVQLSKKTKKKSRTKVQEPGLRSSKDETGFTSSKGIVRSDVFYYSDSDTSSTLDVSSLDEAAGKALGKENWLLDSDVDFCATDSKADQTLSPRLEAAGETSEVLNLNMKDADVKRIVREEFMRMMEKSKHSLNQSDRNYQIGKTPESSQAGRGYGTRLIAAQEENLHRGMKRNEPVVEMAGRDGSLTQQLASADVETQVPSPLMQTWHGDSSAPASLRRDPPPHSTSHEARGPDLRNTGVGPDTSNQSEKPLAGLNHSGPVRSTSEAPINKSMQNGFKPRLHSTAYGTDSWLDGTGRESERPTAGDRGEPLMSPLSILDLNGEDAAEYRSSNPNQNIRQPGQSNEQGNPNSFLFDGASRPERPPPPTYHSTFRFALQVPLLLTVPPERLAQGTLAAAGAGGIRFPLPTQGTSSSQSVPPPGSRLPQEMSQHAPATTRTPRDVPDDSKHHQDVASQYSESSRAPPSYFGHHRSKAESQNLGNSAVPRNQDRVPPENQRFILPMASSEPGHQPMPLLHPSVSQQHYGDGGLPPIPLLHLGARYPAPNMPPPRYPLLPSAHLSSAIHNARNNPENPLPLLKLQSDAKPLQFVPLEELDAFERKQRREQLKHPAVRAREAQEQMEGGRKEIEEDLEEMPEPIHLLHADLRNDLTSTTRQRRRQKEEMNSGVVTTPRADPGVRPQSRREEAVPPTEQPHPGDKPQNGIQDTIQVTEETIEDEKPVATETGRVKRGTRQGQQSKATKPRVIMVESPKERQEPKDSPKEPTVSSSSDEDSEDEKEETDLPMRREDLGEGFAIKPGSFDALLNDPQARMVIPTAAQVHYDTVQKLQAKPKPRRDARTSVKQTKNVSTSMARDDFPHHAPTVAEATSQYTAAATGLTDTGQIVAPDIFFNLRFGASASNQQPSLQDKKDTAPASKGRSFISVVDIDVQDAPSPPPEPLPKDLPQVSSRPPVAVQPSDVAETRMPSPTNAELHYNALFLKDAHPKRTPPKVQFEEEEEEEGDVGGGPDAVTLKLLERKIKANSRHVSQSRARSATARQSTKEKLSERLAQMDQQLNAIEESAANMQEDFRNTSLMLHTVENLTEAMVPTDTRPKAAYSFRDYKEPDQNDVQLGAEEARSLHDTEGNQVPEPADGKLREDGDDGRVALPTEEEEADLDGAEDTALTLGISGISGVSDIIAEVIAEGNADDAHEMGISTRQQEVARRKIHQRRMNEKLEAEDFGHLSSHQIRDLLETPRTPRPDEDGDEDRWPSKRKPTERTEQERKELQEWVIKKRALNLAEYKKQRGEMKERERKPYQPVKSGDMTGASSLKEIKKQEEVRDKKKKDMEEASHSERVQQAKALMAEIFSDKPQLPLEETTSPTTSRRRAGALRESGTGTARRDASGPISSRPDGRPGSQTQKGVSLYIDSGAYRPRPAAGSQRGPTGRIDSRTSRDDALGFSSSLRNQSELGRWTGGLTSSGWGSRAQMSRGREDFDEDYQGTRDNFLEGISEISGSENAENEPEETRPYKRKPYDQLVRVQRPEVTRKKPDSARKPKTYTEMLQEMKGETTSHKRSSSQTLKAKQRLYGSSRIPGSSKPSDSATPRMTKSYSERLSEMQQKSGGQTRLRPRTRPRGVPRINTATMVFDDDRYRRQQVEGRGLHPEPTPRSSTPHHERQNVLSLSGTYRARADVVSPVPKLGIKYKPKDLGPTTYVERLQRASLDAPRTHVHKTVYVGATPRGTGTYKSPPLHMPASRHRPYPSQGQRSQGPEEWDERSGLSDLSSWNVSDDVKNILQRRDSYEGDAGGMTDDDVSLDGLEFDDYAATVDIRQLEEIASVSSGSIMSNIDWGAVDRMIADVR